MYPPTLVTVPIRAPRTKWFQISRIRFRCIHRAVHSGFDVAVNVLGQVRQRRQSVAENRECEMIFHATYTLRSKTRIFGGKSSVSDKV